MYPFHEAETQEDGVFPADEGLVDFNLQQNLLFDDLLPGWNLTGSNEEQGLFDNVSTFDQNVFGGSTDSQFNIASMNHESMTTHQFGAQDNLDTNFESTDYFDEPIYNAALDRAIGSIIQTSSSLPELEQRSSYLQEPPLMSDNLGTNMSNIRGWFTNRPRVTVPTRQSLPRRRSIYRMNSPLHSPVATPVLVHGRADQASLDPMQRWENSPPADEPISMSTIARAIADADINPRSRRHSRTSGRTGRHRNGSSQSRRAPSTSSVGSAISSHSNRSVDSLPSAASSNNGVKPSNRVRKSRQLANPSIKDKRIYQCTFCCDTFKSKYDWVRHEKSLHLVLEKWLCTPEGGVVTSPATRGPSCAYCDQPNPTPAHLEIHDHNSCSSKPPDQRTFRRKDHLKQHMRLVHGIDNFLRVDEWKTEKSAIRSRCGFCDAKMQTWDERAQHLSIHFRQGKKMEDWQGTHGFDTDVQSEVTNAVPPYLIGSEARSLIPYSATNPHSQDHFAQMKVHTNDILLASLTTADGGGEGGADAHEPSNSPDDNGDGDDDDDHPVRNINFVENLTRHLGRYAQGQIGAGVVPSDDMFQQEARRIIFGCDDPWNQTMADSKEWLEEFRRMHALDSFDSPG